ncbi:MAG: hypothetical protein RLZZ74_3445 [Cyanobacteriota bacterium]|jgi:hypothetical protein
MKDLLNITRDDCLALANFITVLRGAKLPEAALPQICQFADGVRWLQDLAGTMAKAYAEAQKPADEPGYTIKAIHPGGDK